MARSKVASRRGQAGGANTQRDALGEPVDRKRSTYGVRSRPLPLPLAPPFRRRDPEVVVYEVSCARSRVTQVRDAASWNPRTTPTTWAWFARSPSPASGQVRDLPYEVGAQSVM